MADKNESISLKAVIVGYDGVGKTSLVLTHLKGQFPSGEVYIPLVTDAATVLHCDHKGRQISLTIWDTGSGIDYTEHRHHSYRDAHVCLFLFDVLCDSDIRFELAVSQWLKDIRLFSKDIPIICVATRADLRESLQQAGIGVVTSGQCSGMALKHGAVKYMEVSALRNEGVAELFSEVIRIGYKFSCSREQTRVQRLLSWVRR